MKHQTLAHFSHFSHFRHYGNFSSLLTNVCSTTVEIALQIHSILTNKPKVKYTKFNVTSCMTGIYAQVGHLVIQTNKPNLSQNKPNSNPICRKAKIDAKHLCTESYDDNVVLWLCENKANQSQ